MNSSFEIEVTLKDGSTVLDRGRHVLPHLPAPGEAWHLENDILRGFGDRYRPEGLITKVEIPTDGVPELEVQLQPLSSSLHRTMVVLNGNRVPAAIRNRVARSLFSQFASPAVCWEFSYEPQTVLRVMRPDHEPELRVEELERWIGQLLEEMRAPDSVLS